MVTNDGTSIDEIADGIYRVSTSVPPNPALPTGFSFNQILIKDDASLLFHTGPRRMFPLTRAAIVKVLPPEKLRYVAFSHWEADESGALTEWLDTATDAVVVCSQVAAIVSVGDATDRMVKPLSDGDTLELGQHELRWFDAPHVPHGWDCGFMAETTTRTLLCGDLFTQAGASNPPVTESDIVGPSEGMRAAMDYFAHAPGTRAALERMAAFEPRVLACMHGSSYRGDGAAQLRALADALGK